jgi:hypothetical protein
LTSAASGASSKSSVNVGSGFGHAQVPDGKTDAVKFTVQVPTQTLEVIATPAQSSQSVTTGDSLAFEYANASPAIPGAPGDPGTKQYVSAVLTKDDGTGLGPVVYYTKLVDSSTAASGSLNIPLAGVPNGTYTLKIFSEEANGDNYTDFASTPIAMKLVIADGTATVNDFSGTIDGTPLTYKAEQTGGVAGTADSTGILIDFNQAVSGITADDITITNDTGQVTKGALTGTGKTRTLELASVEQEGNVIIDIKDFGNFDVITEPITVAVYKNNQEPSFVKTTVTYNATQTGGISEQADSTGIIITFAKVVDGLTDSDITITDGTGKVTRGALVGSGTTRTIELTSVEKQGNIIIDIKSFANFEVTTSAQTVAVYRDKADPTPTKLNYTATQTGGKSTTATTKAITITFSKTNTQEITTNTELLATTYNGLTTKDIIITDNTANAVIGDLSQQGNTYTLEITSVEQEGTLTIDIQDFNSYEVVTTPQTVEVYKNTIGPNPNPTPNPDPAPTPTPDIPQTGDTTNPNIPWVLALVALSLIAAGVIITLRNKQRMQ